METLPPVRYSPQVCDEICAHIADGKSVRALCEYPGMPDKTTIFRWLVKYEGFRQQYIRARGERATARFEKIDDVIQDMRNDIIDHKKARVEIEAIKWQLGREDAAKYGDRIIHAGDEHAPLHTKDVSDGDRRALSRFLQTYPERVSTSTTTSKKEDYDDIC